MATTVRQASLAKAATAAASDEFPEWEIATFKELGPQKPKLLLLKRAAGVLTKVFHLFGIDEGSEFPFVAQAGGQGSEEALKAPMEHITLLREKARELARSKAAPEAFVSLCTHVNQEVMPSLEALAAAAPAQAVSPGQVNVMSVVTVSYVRIFARIFLFFKFFVLISLQLVQVLRQFVREVGEKSQQGPQQVPPTPSHFHYISPKCTHAFFTILFITFIRLNMGRCWSRATRCVTTCSRPSASASRTSRCRVCSHVTRCLGSKFA